MDLKGRFTFVEYLRTVRTTRPRLAFEAKEATFEIVRRVSKDEREFVVARDFTDSGVWVRLRMDVLEAKGRRCMCCGSGGRGLGGINIDHKRSRRDYPQLALLFSNLQPLCGACNKGKGNRYDTDWERRPAGRGGPAKPRREGRAGGRGRPFRRRKKPS
jgi:HNH endonuclease